MADSPVIIINEPPWPHAVGIVIIVFFFVCFLALLIGTCLKNPAGKDKIVTTNRRTRHRRLIMILAVMFMFSGPIIWFTQKQDSGYGLTAMYEGWIWTAVAVFIILNSMIGLEVTEDISADLLEFSTPEVMKEAMKNTWTNTALLAALMFTIVVTYNFPHDAQSQLEEFPGSITHLPNIGPFFANRLSTLQFMCASISFVEYLMSMLIATIHLMFTEPLSVEDATKYYYDNPRAPAEPLIWFAVRPSGT
jgi:hypothetical protein